MPIFEAVQDKTTVVFDFGTAYTKCGFAGENAPRCIIPSVLKRKCGQTFKLNDNSITNEELYDGLVEFIHHLYFRELLVNTKERKVVVVESIFTTTKFRNILAKVLFKHFEVPSIYFGMAHIISLLTLGLKVGLVIDCGFKETVVLPIYHSFPLLQACQILPTAGSLIHKFLKEQLLEQGIVKMELNEEIPLSVYKDKLTEKILEDIKIKTCFVTRFDRAEKIRLSLVDPAVEKPAPPPFVEYPMNGNFIVNISGQIREETCEVLFQRENNEDSLGTVILKSITRCPIDTRKELSENLLVIGGTAMLPGFKSRLMNELRKTANDEKFKSLFFSTTFKLHTAPCNENYTAWLGGAIFGSLEIILSVRSLTRDHYMASGHVPDWCCLSDHDDVVDDRFITSHTT